MQPSTIILSFALALATAPVSAASANPSEDAAQTSDRSPTRVLELVQDQVADSAIAAMRDDDFTPFADLIEDLRGLNTGGSPQLEYHRDYWLAYSHYQKAVSHLRASDMEGTRQSLGEAEKVLSGMQSSDREVGTLRALVGGLQLMFTRPSEIAQAAKATGALLEAIRSEDLTDRSSYALAVSDWNTPPEFGGRREAEKVLAQALRSPAEPTRPLGPSWGRDELEALMIQILMETGRRELAADRLENALENFPNSAALLSISQL